MSQPWAAPKKPILNRVNIYNDPISNIFINFSNAINIFHEQKIYLAHNTILFKVDF